MLDTETQQPQTQQPPEAETGRKREKGTFPCPDCERVFDSAQGLGRHRTATHGYKSKNASKKVTGRRGTPKVEKAPPMFSEEKLLKSIYPNGNVPLSAMAETVSWLNEGRSLYQKAIKT